MGAPNRRHALYIGQAEVEQDNIDRVIAEIPLRFGHRSHDRQFRIAGSLLVKHFAQQSRVARIVFNQECAIDEFVGHQLDVFCGSLVLVSQKALILLTMATNASHCAGLRR